MLDSGLHSRAEPFAFAAIQSIASLQYYCLAAIVVLYYDFALTLGQEIERIWRQRISMVSCIFFLNRYLTCFGYIPVVYFLFNSPNNDKVGMQCTMFARFPGSLSTITQSFIVVLLVMRVYVLYQGKAWVLWVTVPLGVLTVGIAAWGLMQIQTTNLSFGPQALFRACVPSVLKSSISACSLQDTVSVGMFDLLLKIYHPVFKVSWFINGAFDTVVFLLTVYKTCSLLREHRKVGMQSGLARLLVRDGGMFYAVLAVANLVNVIFFLIEENTFLEESAGNNSVLTHILSSTLLSRLILNLREAGSTRVDTNSARFSSRFSSARREDIMLVSASTFSNSATMHSADSSGLTTVGSTAVGTVAHEALTQSEETHV